MSELRVLDAPGRDLVRRLLADRPAGAVVLERLPRAAGATRWFHCCDPDQLEHVLGCLQPASVVSFYFDGRISRRRNDADLRASIESILGRDPDVCVGWLSADGVEIDMDHLCGDEVDDLIDRLGIDSRPYVGRFPDWDDDGVDAVTAVVPDADGTVRHEPQ